jgi:hypothetical protein
MNFKYYTVLETSNVKGKPFTCRSCKFQFRILEEEDRLNWKNLNYICPECKKEHRKRGPFCSQSCHNSHREVSDKVRENMRKVSEDYHRTPEAIAAKKMINSPLSSDEYGVNIPDFPELPEGYDIADKW